MGTRVLMDAKAYYPGIGDNFYSFKEDRLKMLGKIVYEPLNPPKGILLRPEVVYNVPEVLCQYPVYIVSPGIGDISWAYSKLCNLKTKFVMEICDGLPSNSNPRYARSIPFAKLLPNVVYATNAFCEGHQAYVMSQFANMGNGSIPKKKTRWTPT